MGFELYEVGGCVRDELLGLKTKDIDFTVVANQTDGASAGEVWARMNMWLTEQGFKVFLATEEYLTTRAKFPEDHPTWSKLAADFVLARRDGTYSDGRRPDQVYPGTLEDDIMRRDFTVNALARAEDGEIIDLVGGLDDLKAMRLRFVGDPRERIAEDGLRVLRGLRFMVTKGLRPDGFDDTYWAIAQGSEAIRNVSVERIREELHRMFMTNTPKTWKILNEFSAVREAIFETGIRFEPTLKQ